MNRICELRKQNKLTQKALAEKLQVDQSAVSYWECGRAFPDTQKQIMLADLFGVTIDYVLGRDVPREIPRESAPIAEAAPAPVAPAQPTVVSGLRRINVHSFINSITYASNTADAVDHIDIPADWEGEYFGIIVKGDSMSPRYLDGDTVIVRKQSTCENGMDALVFVGPQDGALKKVFIDTNNSITLKPINPSYRTMFFTDREVDSLPLVIGGVAVELRRKILH